jgi:ribosomal protein L30/L7E
MAGPEPLLTAEDRDNRLWLKLKANLEDRLTALRIQNDSTKLTLDDTNKLRGRIQEVKRLLSLGTATPIVDEESDLFKD